MTKKQILSCGLVWLAALTAQADAAGSGQFDRQMQPILKSYLTIGSTLAADSTKGIKRAGQAIAAGASKLDAGSVSGEHAAHYGDLPTKLREAAQALATSTALQDARTAFKELSKPMAMWVSMSKPKRVDVVYCSMAKASWVQKHGNIRNPYHGTKMLSCGEVVGNATSKTKTKHAH